MRLLVVEDDVDIVALFRPVLEGAGFVVDSVPDSMTAVEAVSNHKYDLVLMDLLLARSSGIVATLALRGLGYAGPVVAVTGVPMAVGEAIWTACRFSGRLIKPIAGFPDSLIKEINKHVPRKDEDGGQTGGGQ